MDPRRNGTRATQVVDVSARVVFAQTRFFSAGLGQLSAADGLAPLSLSNSKETAPLAPRTLLLLRPYTGKTHQLRVAAKSVGLPLAGDPVYKDRYDSSATLDRTYLHATALEIPASKDDTSICFPESISLWCPPPFAHFWQNEKEFNEVLQRLVDKHCESAELRALCRGPYHEEISP
ncbi:hypothetical protein FisN_26Hh002 [Fistulifera solaris]|uniref:Pseudouridine synthase RsuA/RluA-like domain-containing protein n=1 Tax=Fistulifera solaris TaxID=1519565 RepID=A0A1Z5JXW2_FISSO|nr:hypothetical protein FisN_26Hh002 [Fistulifera solaris]|eukprot:GAX18712.1 hypothetical protein FisN_26Hh002 [Fistulifera solaris]